jgi:hypothetical protein
LVPSGHRRATSPNLTLPRPNRIEPADVATQHVAVQEHQGAERLVLGTGSDMVLHSEVGKERLDFRRTPGAGVANAVGAKGALGPMGGGAFGGQGQVLDSCQLPDWIEPFHAGPSED